MVVDPASLSITPSSAKINPEKPNIPSPVSIYDDMCRDGIVSTSEQLGIFQNSIASFIAEKLKINMESFFPSFNVGSTREEITAASNKVKENVDNAIKYLFDKVNVSKSKNVDQPKNEKIENPDKGSVEYEI